MSDAEIDSVLADFRAWLEELPAADLPGPESPPVDLYSLVAQFTALRQEVNLQTRTSRAQLELQAQAIEQLRQAAPRPAVAPSEVNGDAEALRRPLVQALIDAADVQFLAVREIGRVVENVTSALEDVQRAKASPLPEPPRLGWLARVCGADRVVEKQREMIEHLEERLAVISPEEIAPVESVAKPLEGALTGLQIGLQRLEGAMERLGITPIPALGRQFDPEQMEVLEGVAGMGRPAGEVVEELRRGYLWNGRLFRYAQVRVAR